MSSTLTARTELVPLPGHQLHAVQPVMPATRPAASPARTAYKEAGVDSIVPSSKLDTFPLKSTGKTTGAGMGAPEARTVLGRVNLNVASNATSIAGGLHKRSAPRPTKTIPRPAAAPDVFGSAPSTQPQSLLGKRPRGDAAATSLAAASLSKRQRAEATAIAAKSHREEQDRWLQKWLKVFPTLVFHFEIGAEEGAGRGLRQRVLGMGAKIDQFFSHRVSHLIVKDVGSPQKAKRTRKGTYSGAASDNPFLDKTGVTDLVDKARSLNIKVWTIKKLSEMVNQLAPLDATAGDSLSHLLADEKLNGTRERDLTAPRSDFYYFKSGNCFLLVEDATGRSRPVMVKEYSAKDRAWPVLHEHFLRPPSSSQLPPSVQDSHNLHKDLRARALALYVDRVPFRGELPSAPEIKPRSQSTVEVPVTPLPELPYAKASGNSVVITSAIASTSTANLTPNAFVGGVPQLGTNKDRAIMQMSKRVQVLKGNARLAASVSAKKAGGSENRPPESTPSNGHNARRRSTGYDPTPVAPKEFLSQAQVITMLQQLREPTTAAKPSYEARAENRAQVDAGYKRKEQDTASGYCENCRVRYTDLSVHIASRKHRRFAATAKNFEDLDIMLASLRRPPNPLLCAPTKVCRPCTKRHDKDAQCGYCMDDPDLFSSPPPSLAGSSPVRTPTSARRAGTRGAYDDGSDTEYGVDDDNTLEAIEEEDEGEGEHEHQNEDQWEEGDCALEA